MKRLHLTADKVLLLEEIISFWIEDYQTTGTKHSMMPEAKELLRELKR
jgi:hypothetical protein